MKAEPLVPSPVTPPKDPTSSSLGLNGQKPAFSVKPALVSAFTVVNEMQEQSGLQLGGLRALRTAG